MKAMFGRFVREDAGQDLLEYGLLIGIVTIAVLASLTLLGPRVALYYENLCNRIGC